MGSHHGEEDNLDFEKFKEKVLKQEQESAGVTEAVLQEKFEELDKLRLGATGKFPQGKLGPQDEGEIKFSIGLSMDKKKVIMNFGKKVRWVGMNRNQAIDVGKAIIQTANQTAKGA